MTEVRLRNLIIAILCVTNAVCLIALWRTKSEPREPPTIAGEATAQIAGAGSSLPPEPLNRPPASRDGGMPSAATTAAAKSQHPATVYRADVIRAHPEYAALLEKETRRGMLARCDQLLATLDLPPAEVMRVRDLIVELFQSMADAQELARAKGLVPGSPDYAQAFERPRLEVQDSLRAALGEHYERVMMFDVAQRYKQELETSYAVDFRDANALLTRDQTLQLAELMAGTFGRADERDPAAGAPGASGLRAVEEQLLGRASQFMTPQQVEVLRSRFIEENQRAAILASYPSGVVILP